MAPLPGFFVGRELAFFPVGCGYLGQTFPRDGVMFVGSEFGTEQNVEDVLKAGGERISDPTWRPALRDIDAVGIDRSKCWFTNFALAVRPGAGSNSKSESPWVNNLTFVHTFGALFIEQVREAQPRAIVLYGGPVAKAMATLDPDSFGHLNGKRFVDRDANNGALRSDVGIGDVNVKVVASLIHPSKGHMNRYLRSFNGYSAVDAELALMRSVAEALAD